MTVTLKLGSNAIGDDHTLLDEDGNDLLKTLQVTSFKVEMDTDQNWQTKLTLVCYLDNVEVEVDGNIKVEKFVVKAKTEGSKK